MSKFDAVYLKDGFSICCAHESAVIFIIVAPEETLPALPDNAGWLLWIHFRQLTGNAAVYNGILFPGDTLQTGKSPRPLLKKAVHAVSSGQ